MTLLSLFMTSTGIFCFVPISHRLVESGIIPVSNSWQFRRLPSVLAPTFYARHELDRPQFLLSADETGNAWSAAEARHQMPYPPPQTPSYSADEMLTADRRLAIPCTNETNSDSDIVSPRECSTTDFLLQSASINTFYGCESTSFISATQDSTLCDSCNTLLRREIPPDHIPSVVRALTLFEAQDRFSDVGFNECEVVALTNAFSMLRL